MTHEKSPNVGHNRREETALERTKRRLQELEETDRSYASNGGTPARSGAFWSDMEIRELIHAAEFGFCTGYTEALRDYAWWKDGKQYVGGSGSTACSITLKDALLKARRE